MNILIGSIFIWIGVALALRHITRTAPERLPELRRRVLGFLAFMAPRFLIGIIGAGFLAALLPPEIVKTYFSADAGVRAIVLSSLVGAITPGGPFVALPICASALKAGAGAGAVVAYFTAWSLYALSRTLGYELSLLGTRTTLVRMLVCSPIPVAVGVLFQALR